MNYKKYLDTQIKKTESNLNSRIKNNDFEFFYNCVMILLKMIKKNLLNPLLNLGCSLRINILSLVFCKKYFM